MQQQQQANAEQEITRNLASTSGKATQQEVDEVEDGDIDEEGLNKEDIETVIAQVG